MCLSAACVSNFCILAWPKEKQGEATTPLTIADLLGSVFSQFMDGCSWRAPGHAKAYGGVCKPGVWILLGREGILGVMKIRETFVWWWWGDGKWRRSQSRALKNTNTLKKDLKFEV